MSLKSLQLVFRFSNVSGLSPFRLAVLDEGHEAKGRCNKCLLVGHWRHPANWWFTLLLIGQVYNTILIEYETYIVIQTSSRQSNSAMLVLTTVLADVNYLIMISITRLFLFRIRHLAMALEQLVRIDRILTRIIPTSILCSSRKRTIAGIFISFVYAVSLQK